MSDSGPSLAVLIPDSLNLIPSTKAKALAQQVARASRFEDFWSVYPMRKGKAKARAKWERLGLDAIADRIIADVQNRLAHDRQWLEGYIPHGSTYVNGRGWEDAIETARVNGTGPPIATNPGGISPKVTGEEARRREREALAAMKRQLGELGQ